MYWIYDRDLKLGDRIVENWQEALQGKRKVLTTIKQITRGRFESSGTIVNGTDVWTGGVWVI